ncbi:MAG: hypothetical protein K9J16_17730 [Melioribacteraceae bacterium]|nr:hypothetical protein [Melioribacteraceae bacterium]MCF8353563.1 hypothetical protein [Melioribacteraceae bacterium]MCF8393486.1 hypothetical protein [Melioribacteraceae bacterium]MCF8419296.1 hypothetical protein [Melioribacteraceae bacterium]
MATDWEQLEKDSAKAAEHANEETDYILAGKISSLTRMTDEEVKELFPKPADVKKLAELMKIVKSTEDRNEKINKIIERSEEFGNVIVTLLDKFI